MVYVLTAWLLCTMYGGVATLYNQDSPLLVDNCVFNMMTFYQMLYLAHVPKILLYIHVVCAELTLHVVCLAKNKDRRVGVECMYLILFQAIFQD